MNVISGLDAINKVIGIELLSQSLLPAISDLAQDTKWRVRLAVIEHLPMLAKHLGKEFFLYDGDSSVSTELSLSGNLSLMQLSVKWLSDEVFQIRKAAADNLFKLSQLFGLAWTSAQIIPAIQKLKTHTKYSQRLTALYIIQVLLGIKIDRAAGVGDSEADQEKIYRSLLRAVFDLSTDIVPNIRLNVAKTLLIAASQPKLSAAICKSSAPGNTGSGNVFSETFGVLDKLMEDVDRDVKYFARKVGEFILNLAPIILLLYYYRRWKNLNTRSIATVY